MNTSSLLPDNQCHYLAIVNSLGTPVSAKVMTDASKEQTISAIRNITREYIIERLKDCPIDEVTDIVCVKAALKTLAEFGCHELKLHDKKSDFRNCTVCGLPRGKGPHEFAHGKCMEILARSAKNESKKVAGVVIDGIPTRITVEHQKKARKNAVAKNYRSGNLPSWMYT